MADGCTERLLPGGNLPEAALLFLEDRFSRDFSMGGALEQQLKAATEWVLQALCFAHRDPVIKAAGRRLLACPTFTRNLEAGNSCFSRFLKPALHARLTQLGSGLSEEYAAMGLGAQLAAEAVSAAVGSPETHPLAAAAAARVAATVPTESARFGCGAPTTAATSAPRSGSATGSSTAAITAAHGGPPTVPIAVDTAPGGGAMGTVREHLAVVTSRRDVSATPTQVDLLPCLDGETVRWDAPWTFPEDIYAHALLMVASGIDAHFQTTVATALQQHRTHFDGLLTATHSPAPPKSSARVKTKAAADYRYHARPVSQNNVDVVRCLVTADTPTELLAVAHTLSKTFGGVVKVKNLFSAPETQRAERFHLLPLMLTVAVDAGCTYSTWLRESAVERAIDAYVTARDPGVPQQRWNETTAAARRMLHAPAMSTLPVRLLGELQLVLSSHAHTRHAMHEVYKAYRADTCQLLYEDFACTQPGADAPQDPPRELVKAAREGNRDVVLTMLDRANGSQSDASESEGGAGAIDAVNSSTNTTALYEAARWGHTDVAKVLIDLNAAVNGGDAVSGATPLFIAAQHGLLDVVALLLAAHASVDTPRRDTGSTPLFTAAQVGHCDVAELLLTAGAKVSAARTSDRATPLWIAAQEGRAEVIELLLARGSAVDVATADAGATPLYVAAAGGHVAAVRALVAGGARVNSRRADTGSTPLYAAAEKGHAAVVRLLAAAGADVDLPRADHGATPLFVAAQGGHTAVVEHLVDAKANVDTALGDKGVTPLFIAAQNNHLRVVHLLVRAGAVLDAATADARDTPLCIAARAGFVDVVEALLSAGAEVDPVTVEGDTPITLAAYQGHEAVVAALYRAGADATRPDGTGITATGWAEQLGHAAIIKLLCGRRIRPLPLL